MTKKIRLYNDVLRALSMVLDMDEGQKLYHARRVGVLSYRLAKFMEIPGQDFLYTVGLLHDIGGVGLEDHLIHHARRGFKDRRARSHPQKGAAILSPFSLFDFIVPFITDHHEYYDGTGFPAGKKGDEIAVEAAIVLMADILEVSLRNGDVQDKQKEALAIAKGESGRKVNPAVAEAAIDLLNRDTALIPALFDDTSLKELVHTVNTDPPEIENLTRREMLSQLLWLFARIIDTKSPFAMGHSSRVTYYAQQIAEAFGNDEINKWDILWAGLLHDVGIVSIPEYIIKKLHALTDKEEILYQRHAEESIIIISTISDLAYLAYPAAAHHEWYDGSGYPRGNAGEDIPLLGRILAYADTFDSLTARQGFGERVSPKEAIKRMGKCIGTQFDPHLGAIATEVLEGFGAVNLQLQKRMEDFNLFYQTKQADIGKLLIDPNGHQTPVIMADKCVILEDLKPWYALDLSPDLKIMTGKKDLIRFTADIQSENLLDFLDENGKSEFIQAISHLPTDKRFTRYVVSVSHHPLEMIIVKKKGRYEIIYRSAAQKIDPLKRISLLYRNFLTSAEGTVFLDHDGAIIDANQSFIELYQYQLDEVAGQKLKMLKADEQPVSTYHQMWKCLTDKDVGTWSGEMVNRKKSGEAVTVLLTINTLFDSTGTVVGYIGQYHDITERKKQEEALLKKDLELERKNRELEKLNQLKSDLIAITSHDLKSPISAMVGYADLLKNHLDRMSKEKVIHYLDGIINAGHHQLIFINDLLDLYKFESDAVVLEKKPIRLDALLQESVRINTMAGQAKKISINLAIDGDASMVEVDEMRMRQVFNNLLSNAIKFSPQGAKIDVHYSEIDGQKVQIIVDDQGPGVREADLDRIFDRYYQAKNRNDDSDRMQGIGLGLYISKHIVNFHRGTLRAENRPDRGSRFTMDIPLTAPKPGEGQYEANVDH